MLTSQDGNPHHAEIEQMTTGTEGTGEMKEMTGMTGGSEACRTEDDQVSPMIAPHQIQTEIGEGIVKSSPELVPNPCPA